MKKQYWTYLCLSFFWMLSNPILATQLKVFFAGKFRKTKSNQIDVIQESMPIMTKRAKQLVSYKEFALEIVKQVKNKYYKDEKVAFFIKKRHYKANKKLGKRDNIERSRSIIIFVTKTEEEYKETLKNTDLAEVKLADYFFFVTLPFVLSAIETALCIIVPLTIILLLLLVNADKKEESDEEYDNEE